ncbi:hypothetical protein EC890511_4858, partial [Escherichia coli 89.0511]
MLIKCIVFNLIFIQ